MRDYFKPRTKNGPELRVLAQLEAEGYKVIKRGWPDFLAVKGDSIRFIEVKPKFEGYLKPARNEVRQILQRLGITVEVITA